MTQMFYDGRPFSLNASGELLDPARAAQLAEIEIIKDEEKQIALLHYMVGVYARGRDYTNFIIAAGYAAFIALWSGVAKDVAVEYRLLSGGLIAVSLVSFLAWEIAKMVFHMNQGRHIAAAVTVPGGREELLAAIKRAQKLSDLEEVIFDQLWPLSFYTALTTGLTGGLLLAVACLTTGGYLALN